MTQDRFEDLARCAAGAVRSDPATWPSEAARFAAHYGPELAREVVRCTSLFFGLPSAIRALDLAADALAAHGRPDPRPHLADPAAAGLARFREVYGSDAPAVLARLDDLDPHLRDWVLRYAYARGYAGPQLTLIERERLAVLALAATGCWKQCDSHLRACRRHGASAARLRDDAAAGGWLTAVQIALLRSRIPEND